MKNFCFLDRSGNPAVPSWSDAAFVISIENLFSFPSSWAGHQRHWCCWYVPFHSSLTCDVLGLCLYMQHIKILCIIVSIADVIWLYHPFFKLQLLQQKRACSLISKRSLDSFEDIYWLALMKTQKSFRCLPLVCNACFITYLGNHFTTWFNSPSWNIFILFDKCWHLTVLLLKCNVKSKIDLLFCLMLSFVLGR